MNQMNALRTIGAVIVMLSAVAAAGESYAECADLHFVGVVPMCFLKRFVR